MSLQKTKLEDSKIPILKGQKGVENEQPLKGKAPKLKVKTDNSTFWYETEKGKEEIPVLNINQSKLLYFLGELGYKKFRANHDEIFIIKDVDNIITKTSESDIRNFVMNKFIDELEYQISENFNKEQLRDMIVKGINNYINSPKLDGLRFVKFEFLRDTDKESRFFFNNCFVSVTKSGVRVKDYSELKGKIWDTQQINHDFKITNKYNDLNFAKFIQNVTGKDSMRLKSLQTAIGYLLSSFNDVTYPKAVVIKDENIARGANGRTGKTLIINAVGQMKAVAEIDGKTLDTGATFAWSQINRDTGLVAIDDVRQRFDFETLYGFITGGYKVNKKGKSTLEFNFAKNPKTAITTNYDVNTDDGSSKGRIYELELANYYSSSFKPSDEFGERFWGATWTKETFNRFYNYMLNCNMMFIQNKNRISDYDSKTLEINKLQSQLSEGLIQYLDESEVHGTRVDKKILYFQYINEISAREKSYYNTRKFNKEVKMYCKLKGLELIETVGNSTRYFQIK